MKIHTLIVDDMLLARKRIRRHLSADPEVEVVGECAGGREPAELEVLRLTAGGRAGYHFTGMGVFGTLLTLLTALPLIMLGTPKAISLGAFLLLLGGSTSLIVTLVGALQLRRTLNNVAGARPTLEAGGRPSPPLFQPGAGAPRLAWGSVTEGPTEPLGRARESRDEREGRTR